jgi:hypothetical protein
MLDKRGSFNAVIIVNSFCSLKEFCLLLTVSWMRNMTFVLNHRIQVKGRSTVALVRDGLILQARGSCTLLSMVNCVSF